MITVYAIHYSCLTDHVFTWVCDKLVATELLKDDSLKANRSEPVSAF